MATFQVAASGDDAYRRLGNPAFSLTQASVSVGSSGGVNYALGAGMRFLNITIPKGSTIDSTKLTFVASASRSNATVNSRISAEDVDDAITFADNAGAFDTRWANRTTARMDWDGVTGWTAETEYDSPTTDGATTFASIIQEVIDRGGWASGNDIVIFWEDFDNRSTAVSLTFRDAYSWDNDTNKAPKLVITWTEPPGRAANRRAGWWVIRH